LVRQADCTFTPGINAVNKLLAEWREGDMEGMELIP
jgi:hypothetical protein